MHKLISSAINGLSGKGDFSYFNRRKKSKKKNQIKSLRFLLFNKSLSLRHWSKIHKKNFFSSILARLLCPIGLYSNWAAVASLFTSFIGIQITYNNNIFSRCIILHVFCFSLSPIHPLKFEHMHSTAQHIYTKNAFIQMKMIWISSNKTARQYLKLTVFLSVLLVLFYIIDGRCRWRWWWWALVCVLLIQISSSSET